MSLNLAQKLYKYLRFRNMIKLAKGVPILNFALSRTYPLNKLR